MVRFQNFIGRRHQNALLSSSSELSLIAYKIMAVRLGSMASLLCRASGYFSLLYSDIRPFSFVKADENLHLSLLKSV